MAAHVKFSFPQMALMINIGKVKRNPMPMLWKNLLSANPNSPQILCVAEASRRLAAARKIGPGFRFGESARKCRHVRHFTG